jgi:hypothetical protein
VERPLELVSRDGFETLEMCRADAPILFPLLRGAPV